ncbi:MAG: hypothetical protein JWR85_1830, partial [Marmoricola sp.]|nr:hypothetical protein [Marmoricola sp.]
MLGRNLVVTFVLLAAFFVWAGAGELAHHAERTMDSDPVILQ